jgi:hypothetical protein
MAIEHEAEHARVTSAVAAAFVLMRQSHQLLADGRGENAVSRQLIAQSKALLHRGSGSVVVSHRGFRILAERRAGGWRARLEGVGALSHVRATALDAIGELADYLDEALPVVC